MKTEPIAGPLSSARSDKAILPAASAAPVEAVEVRSPKDYAIEHAGYMATAAKTLIARVNAKDDALGAWESAEDDEKELREQALQEAVEDQSESLQAMKSAIYEFEKRRDRARTLVAQPPQAVQEVRMLTEDEVRCAHPDYMLHDRRGLFAAVVRKFCEVNGLMLAERGN